MKFSNFKYERPIYERIKKKFNKGNRNIKIQVHIKNKKKI